MAVSELEEAVPARARRRSILTSFIATLVALAGVVPYALVALGLRLLMARVFFLAGQEKIAGPAVALPIDRGLDLTIVLPAQIKDETFAMFATQYAALPMPPAVAATLFSYAEFVLPICLVLGFATRLAALALLVMTVLVQAYVMPELFWWTHVYWIAILMALMSVGPGAISVDALIRRLYER